MQQVIKADPAAVEQRRARNQGAWRKPAFLERGRSTCQHGYDTG